MQIMQLCLCTCHEQAFSRCHAGGLYRLHQHQDDYDWLKRLMLGAVYGIVPTQ